MVTRALARLEEAETSRAKFTIPQSVIQDEAFPFRVGDVLCVSIEGSRVIYERHDPTVHGPEEVLRLQARKSPRKRVGRPKKAAAAETQPVRARRPKPLD